MGGVLGRVFDIKRFTLHDGPGIRVTVHLKGCPLSCQWCHNPEGIPPGPELLLRGAACILCGKCLKACSHGAVKYDEGRIVTIKDSCTSCGACSNFCPAGAREICGRDMSAEETALAVLADESFFHSEDPEKRGGITLSGGEPLYQGEFCFDLLSLLGRKGIHRVIDTSGYVPEEIIARAADHCELFLYDIKHMDTEKHRLYTGAGNDLILSNLRKLSFLGSRIQLRIPFIPGINTEDENITAIAEMAAGLTGITGVNILPYHKAAADKHRRRGIPFRAGEIADPQEAGLGRACEIFARKGLNAVIGG